MKLIRRIAVLAAVALALTATPLSAANAGGYHWKTMSTIIGAKVQACKVPTTKTGPWRVRVRVDARKATDTVQGSAFLKKGDTYTTKGWRSAPVAPHRISKVGTAKLPRGKKYTLSIGIGTSGMGNGGDFRPKQIPHC